MMAFYNYPLDYLDTFADQVNAVTVQKIKAAFQKRVDMNKFSTVIVGIE
jgi:zinc protease